MDDLNYREVLVKKPFYEIAPTGYMKHGNAAQIRKADLMAAPKDYLWRNLKTQSDFLREYYPTSHIIYDQEIYPDIIKEDPDNPGKYYRQPITRTAFAFQQVIATKHTLHLTGNDVQFEIADGSDDIDIEEHNQHHLTIFKKGWLMSNMEIRHYEAVRSLMIVAESAFVGFFTKDGKFGGKVLSYMTDDVLFPHFDSVTGELTLFARQYFDYDEDGRHRTEWVEVWDETYLYRYKHDVRDGVTVTRLKELFGLNGYALVSKDKHGFPFIPVSYIRNDDGPCWSAVQRNIEDYEEAFSYLCESNKAYAFPIFYIKGDGDEIDIHGDMNGAVKSIAMNDTDSDAGFLNGTDASNAFATQLDKSYNLIYELSFTVKPPELKSGDLPGVAIKLLYSPALEVAMNDAQTMQPFLDKMVKIAKFGIGYENNCQATMVNLPINAWVQPYIHQNYTELVTNIATAVQNKFLSKQTATERCPDFPKNDEFNRIMREMKQEQEMDLLSQITLADEQTDNAIEQEEATARINRQQGGNDVNTGGGRKAGRPNKSGKQWDANGNWPGRNNWDAYNQTH